jgi:hypothetical protein
MRGRKLLKLGYCCEYGKENHVHCISIEGENYKIQCIANHHINNDKLG